MKRKITILIIFIAGLFIIGTTFTYLSLNIKNNNINNNNNYSNNNLLVDKPVIDLGPTNEELVNAYIDKYNNNDVVGIVNIVNTDYEKAIMQTSDNDYYLNHTEDKTANYMGSIYLDFRINIDDGKKLLIFGHNSSNIDMPFKILEKYYDYDYYKEHQYIKITTKNKNRLYQIYSIFIETNNFDYMKTDFKNEEEWYLHINNFKNKSMYDTGININKDDKILILQTCSTHYKYENYNKKYLLIVAKEINSE